MDEVWHEHLTLTRDYWERLCGEVLQKPVHHEAAEAGAGVDPQAAYLYTLDLYTETFGQTPPGDLWPDPRWARPPGQKPGVKILRGQAQVRFLVFTALVVAGFLIWHTVGLLIGAGLGVLVLLSGPRRASLGTSRGGGILTAWPGCSSAPTAEAATADAVGETAAAAVAGRVAAPAERVAPAGRSDTAPHSQVVRLTRCQAA